MTEVWALGLVLLGGAAGAVLRHLVTTSVLGSVRGVLLVNLVGSATLGVLVGAAHLLPGWVVLLLGTGLCGALTTWSTLAVQVWEEARRSPGRAAGLLVTGVVLGLAAGLTGYLLTGLVLP